MAQLSVNDRETWPESCWICGDPMDHGTIPHSEATGDGLTRYDIVALMSQGGYTWRDE